MSKHTQARLTYRPHWSGMGGFELCFDPKGVAMAETPNWGTDEIEADTRRLAACWNYCEGLDTEGMERAVEIQRPVKAFIDESTKKELELLAQRDELLEALEDLLDAVPPLWECAERARAAIDKAKGVADA